MTKIKICGLQTEQDIACVNRLKPDYIGFIFLQGRRRYVSPEKAAQLKKRLDPSIQSVGVFVNETPEHVAALVKAGTIDLVQLHGQEDEAYVEALKRQCACPVIKAFIIQNEADIQKALDFPADHLLLDNGLGTGETFDWSLISQIERPFFLAGGLTPENVKEAILQTHPYGVDTSSGVETDHHKDPAKIEAFITAIRSLSN